MVILVAAQPSEAPTPATIQGLLGRSASRIIATASGSLCPKVVIPATIWLTGSIGVMWVMKKVSEMPMKTTSRNCAPRL